MSTPYGGNDPQQQPQWGQQPGYGQQPGGTQPPSGPQQQPQWGQQPQYDPSQTQQQQPQWGQQPAPYDPSQQQPGYPQSGPQQQPGYDPSQTQQQQPQWGQQQGYPQSGPQQQPGYPQSGPQQQPQYGQPQQQGQYEYGQGQFQGTPGEAQDKPKSKKGLFIGIGALVVIIAAVGILGFVTPGWFNTQVFNNTQMQTDVQKLLTETYKIPNVSAVSCPSGKEVKDGEKFTCTATIDGKPQDVPITVKGDTGNYEVSPPAVTK
ncbi:DUF4333 domain-containing protein [Amycolatopsis regifaucium]|uniref:DUF4333 domain-containing protein n=1 Tax=Amycolatopsis regifaucium TaxID=546365 RepID=A0A154MUX7_9PSEU|nr:DUF4333 domain-containing protein [Amycolatopsis regifaucium]KZB88081.1 hypothetical protein AVL48_19105 [Amycolatopsis regifaucium]OKA04417.1 hypothetical protein ATP06_0231405 [Amycolatopsis regifaucium]SFH48664.1 protein of unknown function [Amycolatopsis regifaucium]